MSTTHSRMLFPVVGWPSVLRLGGALALVVLSWAALFWFVTFVTDLFLPYDTSWYDYWGWPQGSPPPGSWERTLNYFFESPTGSALPGILIVGVSAMLLGVVLLRTFQPEKKPVALLLGFAVSNLVAIPVMFLGTYAVAGWFTGGVTGWSRTLSLWLPTCFLLVLLFVLQVRMLPESHGLSSSLWSRPRSRLAPM
jgi:hypothetical protein